VPIGSQLGYPGFRVCWRKKRDGSRDICKRAKVTTYCKEGGADVDGCHGTGVWRGGIWRSGEGITSLPRYVDLRSRYIS